MMTKKDTLREPSVDRHAEKLLQIPGMRPKTFRLLWRCCCLVTPLLVASLPEGLARDQPAADAGVPNILFIYTDDLAPWGVGAYGSVNAVTPQIDRLAGEGALFERAFVTTPVCSPSRAGLLTGQHSFRTGITDFIHFSREPDLGLSPRFVAWPALLRQTGYRTGMFGKWHLGNRPESHPGRFGYDEVWALPDQPGGSPTENPDVEVNGVRQPAVGFTADIVTAAAIAFLENNPREPVLISLHFREPHTPYGPVSSADDAVYRDRPIEIPGHPGLDRQWAEATLRDYLKSVASIDRNVGRLLDAVDRLGLTERTLVVFTSDNGYMIGHNGLYGKGTATVAGSDIRDRTRRPNMFDHSLRVPLLIRWPGVVAPGSRIPELVTNLDFFPTFVNAAKARRFIPDDYPVHGRDLIPLLHGETIPWRDAIFGDYDMYHYVVDSMRMIRTEDWKLVLHSHPEFSSELYDLRNDPGETVNLAGHGVHFEVLRGLRSRLFAWQEWMADPRRRAPWEPY